MIIKIIPTIKIIDKAAINPDASYLVNSINFFPPNNAPPNPPVSPGLAALVALSIISVVSFECVTHTGTIIIIKRTTATTTTMIIIIISSLLFVAVSDSAELD